MRHNQEQEYEDPEEEEVLPDESGIKYFPFKKIHVLTLDIPIVYP